MNQVKRAIVIGPTGVGKSAFADIFAERIFGEIVNADVCQMYAPLSIGTAKPDLTSVVVPHHLFSCIDVPEAYSVVEFRKKAQNVVDEIEARRKRAVLVGGSGFYLYSLFFPPLYAPGSKKSPHKSRESDLGSGWIQLNAIDPIRAAAIHPSDTYRIERALEIFEESGCLPSQHKPTFSDFEAHVFFVERDTAELYQIIDARVDQMIASGWIDEADALDALWRAFVRKRNVIGYPELLDYIDGIISLKEATAKIKQLTRNYAKRQGTFNRRFKKLLGQHGVSTSEIHLTLSGADLYLERYAMLFKE